MKLDHECIRDLLLKLEEKTKLVNSNGFMEFEPIYFDEICSALPDYSEETIAYTSHKLYESDFIRIAIAEDDFYIAKIIYYDITFEGHQYLDSIREKSIWEKIKPVAGSLTLDGIKALAGHWALKLLP